MREEVTRGGEEFDMMWEEYGNGVYVSEISRGFQYPSEVS
jgi:hypothetical protein